MARTPKPTAEVPSQPTTKLVPNTHLVEILKHLLLPNGNFTGLADELDVPYSELVRARGQASAWSHPSLQKALRVTNDWIREREGEDLTEHDLYISETMMLIDKLPLSKDETRDLCRVLGLPMPPEDSMEVTVLKRLVGVWAVLYLCRDQGVPERSAIAAATFKIDLHSSRRKAVVRETSFIRDKEPMPEGVLQVRHNTIEIDLNYKEADFPVAKYLATVPKHRSKDFILLMSLDVKELDLAIVARPILMIRVENDAVHPRQFNDQTSIYKAVARLLSKFALYQPNLMELNFSGDPELIEYNEVKEVVHREWAAMKKREPR
jgi:hypothetical protein